MQKQLVEKQEMRHSSVEFENKLIYITEKQTLTRIRNEKKKFY